MAKRAFWTMLPLAFALATIAPSQPAGRGGDRALAPLLACRPITDPRARATCYDAALDRLQQSVNGRQVVIVDRDQLAAQRRTLGTLGSVGRSDVTDPVDSTIAAVRPSGYDRFVVRLANGSSWQTVESTSGFEPRAGSAVQVRRSALGGYLLRIGRYRSVRVARVN